jgi:hypothetical protein
MALDRGYGDKTAGEDTTSQRIEFRRPSGTDANRRIMLLLQRRRDFGALEKIGRRAPA